MPSKVAVVTGAAGGLGRATCEKLSQLDYVVVGVDAAGPEVPGPGPLYCCDLSSPSDVKDLFAQIVSEYGPPVLLVNNAGVYQALEFMSTSLEQFHNVFAHNVDSMFLCGQSFAKVCISHALAGRIVNIASISGRRGSPDVAYGTSKAAVIGMTMSLAKALAQFNIQVNAVAPGIIDTPMAGQIPRERLAHYMETTILRRAADPYEIAELVAAVATAPGDYLTGSIIDADGGWL